MSFDKIAIIIVKNKQLVQTFQKSLKNEFDSLKIFCLGVISTTAFLLK